MAQITHNPVPPRWLVCSLVRLAQLLVVTGVTAHANAQSDVNSTDREETPSTPAADTAPPSEPAPTDTAPPAPKASPATTEAPSLPPEQGTSPTQKKRPSSARFEPLPSTTKESSTSASKPATAGKTQQPPQATPKALPAADAELQETPSEEQAPKPNQEAAAEEDDGGGLFGPIRLGPMVGVGLPNVLSFGGLLKLTRYFGAGINIGLIPTIRVSYYGDAKLMYQEYDAFGRIFPFGGGFFLGAGVGYETVKGTLAKTVDTSTLADPTLIAALGIPSTLSYQSAGSVKTMVLTPQIGYFYTTKVGFSIGLDVGAQLPIAPSQIKYSSQFTLPPNPDVANQIRTQLVDPTNQNVYSTLKTVGRQPLPTFNIRIGWLL